DRAPDLGVGTGPDSDAAVRAQDWHHRRQQRAVAAVARANRMKKRRPPWPAGAVCLFSARPRQETTPMLRPNNTPPAHGQDARADLARQIRDHHRQIQRTLGLTLGQMLDTGDLLIAAQGLVQSNWKKWLRTECFLGVSTAQLYQQLARHRHAIEGELSRF